MNAGGSVGVRAEVGFAREDDASSVVASDSRRVRQREAVDSGGEFSHRRTTSTRFERVSSVETFVTSSSVQRGDVVGLEGGESFRSSTEERGGSNDGAGSLLTRADGITLGDLASLADSGSLGGSESAGAVDDDEGGRTSRSNAFSGGASRSGSSSSRADVSDRSAVQGIVGDDLTGVEDGVEGSSGLTVDLSADTGVAERGGSTLKSDSTTVGGVGVDVDEVAGVEREDESLRTSTDSTGTGNTGRARSSVDERADGSDRSTVEDVVGRGSRLASVLDEGESRSAVEGAARSSDTLRATVGDVADGPSRSTVLAVGDVGGVDAASSSRGEGGTGGARSGALSSDAGARTGVVDDIGRANESGRSAVRRIVEGVDRGGGGAAVVDESDSAKNSAEQLSLLHFHRRVDRDDGGGGESEGDERRAGEEHFVEKGLLKKGSSVGEEAIKTRGSGRCRRGSRSTEESPCRRRGAAEQSRREAGEKETGRRTE